MRHFSNKYYEIKRYEHIIKGSPDNPANSEYLFNLLKLIGLTVYSEGTIDPNLLTNVKMLFNDNYLNARRSDTTGPTLIDPENLNKEIDRFLADCKHIGEPPRLPIHFEKVHEWGKKKEALIQKGLYLIENAVAIHAVFYGHRLAVISDPPESWQHLWDIFLEQGNLFINKLINNKNNFFCIADGVSSILAKNVFMPKDAFEIFLYDIATPGKNYAKNQHYRCLFTVDEINELYSDVKEKYSQVPNRTIAYRFESSLAQAMIQKFVQSKCALPEKQCGTPASCAKRLLSSHEMHHSIEIPFVTAGNKLFSVHMLSPGLAGWGMRKDETAIKSLYDSNKSYCGALFFSWEQYPNGTRMCSFDSFKDKAQVEEFLSQNKDEYFARIAYNAICDEDRREEFLEEAANAVFDINIHKQSPGPSSIRISTPNKIDAIDIIHSLIESGYELDINQSADPLLQLAETDLFNIEKAPRVLDTKKQGPSIPVLINQTSQQMAAADSDKLPANWVNIDDKYIEIQRTLITIIAKDMVTADGLIHISGEIAPDLSPSGQMFAWWAAPEQAKPAYKINLSKDKTMFDISFSGIDAETYDKGRLMLLFFSYPGEIL